MVDKLAYKRASYFFNKNGIFHFSRRVPLDLQHHYKSSRISFSLKTTDHKIASSRSKQLATRLDDFWLHLRMQEDQFLGRFLKKPITTLPVEGVVNVGAVDAIVQLFRPIYGLVIFSSQRCSTDNGYP